MTKLEEWLEKPRRMHIELMIALGVIEKMKDALERLDAGYSGMFGKPGMSAEQEAWEMAPEIVETALAIDPENL